jgi:hypothetical protein
MDQGGDDGPQDEVEETEPELPEDNLPVRITPLQRHTPQRLCSALFNVNFLYVCSYNEMKG